MSAPSHKRKMRAPIIATVLMILYYIVYFGFLVSLLGGVWAWIFGIVPFAMSAVTVAVCIERIREIKKGEEDDLSQY